MLGVLNIWGEISRENPLGDSPTEAREMDFVLKWSGSLMTIQVQRWLGASKPAPPPPRPPTSGVSCRWQEGEVFRHRLAVLRSNTL